MTFRFFLICLAFSLGYLPSIFAQNIYDTAHPIFKEIHGEKPQDYVTKWNQRNVRLNPRNLKTHMLDSITIPINVQEKSKISYVYEPERDVTINERFSNLNNQYLQHTYTVHHYDNFDRIKKYTYNLAPWEPGIYVDTLPTSESNYIYNAQGLLSEFYTQNKNHILENRFRSKSTFSYDTLGRLTECSKYTERSGSDTLYRTRQEFFFYNLEHEEELDYSLRWDEHYFYGWINSDSTTYEYINGQLAFKSGYTPDSIPITSWYNISETQYIYNLNGSLDSINLNVFLKIRNLHLIL